MGLAKEFNRITRQDLDAYAAWRPVSNNFKLGDYGVIKNGVFDKLGTITEDFAIDIGDPDNSPASTLIYNAASTTFADVSAEGDASAKIVGPSGKASLKLTFQDSNSMVVNCSEVVASEMPSVRQVAERCKNHDNWERKWRVIRRVFTAKNPLILASNRAGASIDLSGSASALEGLQSGSAAVGLQVGATASGIINLSGEEGIVAIEMFRIGLLGGTLLETARSGSDEWFEDDWGDLLDDD